MPFTGFDPAPIARSPTAPKCRCPWRPRSSIRHRRNPKWLTRWTMSRTRAGTRRRRPPPAAGSAARWSTTTSRCTPVRGPGVPDGLLPVRQRDPGRPHRLARDLRDRVLQSGPSARSCWGLGRPARPQERPGLRDVPDGHFDVPGRVLPTYAQVGALAPLLLVLLRVVQGFAVAGELGGASAMIVEHSPDARRGFFASFSLQGTQAGSILATGALLPASAAAARPSSSRPGAGASRSCSAPSSSWPATSSARRSRDTAFAEEGQHGEVPKVPMIDAITTSWPDMLRVICMALMNVIPVVATIFGAGRRGLAGLRDRFIRGPLSVDSGPGQRLRRCS